MPALPRPSRALTRALSASLAAPVLAALPPAAAADETPSAQMDEIVVTATRIPTPRQSLAASVTVITAQEIARKQLRTLADALKSVPGFSVVQSGGLGTTTSVFSRGTNSGHTLFLMNGRRIGDPAGSSGRFDPGTLLTDNIERIEILRGPRSVLYGSDAIGAVVNVITKKPGGPVSGSALVEAGSFRTLNTQGGFGGSAQGVDFRFDTERYVTGGTTIAPESAGNAENDGASNETASGTLGFAPADNFYVQLFGHYTRAIVDIDEFRVDDPNKRDLRTIRLLQLETTGSFFGGAWVTTFDAAVDDQRFDNVDPADGPGDTDSQSHFDGRILEAGLKNDFAVHPGGTLTLGWESREEKGKSGGDAFFNFDVATPTHSGYSQYQFELFDRLTGTLGVRVDDNEDFGSKTTYGVSAAYRHLETGTKVWAGIGTGFKAPSLVDLFGGVSGLFVGNPNLQPETSRGWEAGVTQDLADGRLSFGATYFENKIDDLIDGFVFDSGLGLFTARNVNKAKTRGVESFVTLTPFETLTIALNHTFTRAEDETKHEDLTRRPKQRGDLDLAWHPAEDVTLDFDTLYVGARKDIGDAREGAYFVSNFTASYAFADGLTAFGRIANLFDREFEDPGSFAHPGIGGFAGLKAAF